MIAGGAGDLSEPIGYVGLGAEIELHVRVDGKAVKAFLTNAPPFAVRLHESLIDAEAGLLADGTFRVAQPPFHLLYRRSTHQRSPLRRV
jgi:hypothetical protein